MTDSESIANISNNHFTSTGSKLAVKFQSIVGSFSNNSAVTEDHILNKFVFTPVGELFAYQQLKTLKTNKAIGLDKVSGRLLKDSAEIITPVLTRLFHRSLESGIFPVIWKQVAIEEPGGKCNFVRNIKAQHIILNKSIIIQT